MSGLRLRNVEVEGQRVDLDILDGTLAAVTPSGLTEPAADTRLIEGAGGAVLPGLHDHHLHLLALAAAGNSVQCGPEDVHGSRDLAERLRAAPKHADGWVRGVGYHESIAGDIDRHVLDAWVPDRPVRLQHQSGGLWMLNSLGLSLVDSALSGSAPRRYREGVEIDPAGLPTGRLWRLDGLLSNAVPRRPLDLPAVGSRLRRLGLTGVTDATPDLSPDAVGLLVDAVERGELPLRVTLLGAAGGVPAPLKVGPAKVLLPDHDLPDYNGLLETVQRLRDAGRSVAVHCVTRESLLLTLAVLDELGPYPGDRIEHGAVVPSEVVGAMARMGLHVVTQPDFLRSRGERYRREVDKGDLGVLYPYATLISGGVPTTASSDAPFGEVDPWRVIASAASRRTDAGTVLGPGERVPVATALDGYLSPADEPGGPPRRLRPGEVADIVLLGAGLGEALNKPSAQLVRLTILADDLVLGAAAADGDE